MKVFNVTSDGKERERIYFSSLSIIKDMIIIKEDNDMAIGLLMGLGAMGLRGVGKAKFALEDERRRNTIDLGSTRNEVERKVQMLTYLDHNGQIRARKNGHLVMRKEVWSFDHRHGEFLEADDGDEILGDVETGKVVVNLTKEYAAMYNKRNEERRRAEEEKKKDITVVDWKEGLDLFIKWYEEKYGEWSFAVPINKYKYEFAKETHIQWWQP